jgi:hypothetical protein
MTGKWNGDNQDKESGWGREKGMMNMIKVC